MAARAQHATLLPYADGRVEIGHDAANGDPADWVARDLANGRVSNGVIAGDAGTGKTVFADRIAGTLEAAGWDVQVVIGDSLGRVRQAPRDLVELLWHAERLLERRSGTDPLYVIVWDDFHRLTCDPQLQRVSFCERVRDLALAGPSYGIAQIAVVPSLLPTEFGNPFNDGPGGGRAVRDALADNVLALPSRHTGSRGILDGFTIIPAELPYEFGHAYSLVRTDRGSDLAHVHLAGCAPVPGCSTCWRAENDRLGQPEQPPHIAGADAAFAEHRPTGRIAHWARTGWRFLTANPGDETPTPRELAELVPVDGVLRGTFG